MVQVYICGHKIGNCVSRNRDDLWSRDKMAQSVIIWTTFNAKQTRLREQSTAYKIALKIV